MSHPQAARWLLTLALAALASTAGATPQSASGGPSDHPLPAAPAVMQAPGVDAMQICQPSGPEI